MSKKNSKKINFNASEGLLEKIEKIKRKTGILHTSEVLRVSITKTSELLTVEGEMDGL